MKKFIALASERWPHLSRKEREYAAILLRRADHLEDCVDNETANDWDLQEINAITWVLKKLDETA